MSIISIIACKVKFEQDFKANNGMVYAAPPNDNTLAQAVQPTRVEQPMTMEQPSKPTTVAQAVQPTTMTMTPMRSQLIQMPNGQLFMLPSNSYSVAQPVVLQALQVVQPVSTNNA